MINQASGFKYVLGILLILMAKCVFAAFPEEYEKRNSPLNNFNRNLFHNDTTQVLSFNKTNKGGLKPYIAPALLITAGTALHFSDVKYNIHDWAKDNFKYSGNADDYIRYAPALAVYSLNVLGIKGKNNFGNRTALLAKGFILNDLIVYSLKSWTGVERPNGGEHSFPSGHTSMAFNMAHFMHKEYGKLSPWYSIGAYSCATAVGLMRVAKGAHWLSDVMVGAGIGMLSMELSYQTHLYKWDKEHLKNFDIFPFKTGKQKGLAMIYTF